MEIILERGEEIERKPRSLPAGTYNRMHILLAHSEGGCLFVPIRTMQYLAVVDAAEVVFVDGQGPRVIEVAWRNFRPQERADLNAPVPCECVLYQEKGRAVLPRLPAEFARAITLLDERQARSGGASVSTFST